MHGNTKHLILNIGGATSGFSQFEVVLWLSKPTREIQLRTNVVIYVGHEGNKSMEEERRLGMQTKHHADQASVIALYCEEHTLGGKAWLMEVSVVCCRRCRHAKTNKFAQWG